MQRPLPQPEMLGCLSTFPGQIGAVKKRATKVPGQVEAGTTLVPDASLLFESKDTFVVWVHSGQIKLRREVKRCRDVIISPLWTGNLERLYWPA